MLHKYFKLISFDLVTILVLFVRENLDEIILTYNGHPSYDSSSVD
jgi:hypothetical protein